MKFSIITPSLNQGKFIRDCIESVLAQTGVASVEIEHIVIDAASTDETLPVLREYPHLKWISEPDKGMSDGINKGFAKAAGDWVMWLNADDYLLPDALQKVAGFAAAHAEADVIYGGWNFVDENKTIKRAMKLFPFDFMMLVHYGTYIGSTACFFRRKTTVEQGFLLNVNFRVNMDGEYYARLGKAGKRFSYLPGLLACFRLHGENTSLADYNARDIDRVLRLQKQFAEAATIRRVYGWTFFNDNLTNAVADAILWYYYRVKKVILKIMSGSYA